MASENDKTAVNWEVRSGSIVDHLRELTRKMKEEWIGLTMTELQRKALASRAISEGVAEGIYGCVHIMTRERLAEELKRVLVSHERLRAELEGSQELLAEAPSKENEKRAIDAVTVMEKALRWLQSECPESHAVWVDDKGNTRYQTIKEWVDYVIDQARGRKPESFVESIEAFMFGEAKNANKD